MRTINQHIVSSNPLDLGNTLATPFQSAPTVIATTPTFLSGNMQLFPAVSGTLSASFSTPGFNILHEYGFSVTAVISGSLTGSVSLWASNDPGNDRLPPAFNQQTSGQAAVSLNQGIVNWSLITNPTTSTSAVAQLSASTLGGPSNVCFNVSQQFYKWLQVQWSHSVGTGSIDCYLTAKGNRE